MRPYPMKRRADGFPSHVVPKCRTNLPRAVPCDDPAPQHPAPDGLYAVETGLRADTGAGVWESHENGVRISAKMEQAARFLDEAPAERSVSSALVRGWRRCCPRCGAGPLYQGYLKVRDGCPACGQDLFHHRADDGPAYLTILIVGHLMAPLLLYSFVHWRPEPMVLATVFSLCTVALSLFLLPRLKGALIGLQWAKRMHGFGQERDH